MGAWNSKAGVIVYAPDGATPCVSIPGTLPAQHAGIFILGSDGVDCHIPKTDDQGRLDIVGATTGTVGVSDVGFIRASSQDVLSSISFRTGLKPTVSQDISGSTATLSVVDRKAVLATGTAVGRCELLGREHYPITTAAVTVCQIVMDGDAAVAGNMRTWGAGSYKMLNGYFFRLEGTVLKVVRLEEGAVLEEYLASAWSVLQDFVWDTRPHVWGVHLQSVGAGKVLFSIDGTVYHIIDYTQTTLYDTQGNYNIACHVENINTTSQAQSVDLRVHQMGSYYEGADTFVTARREFRAYNENDVAIAQGAYTPVLGIKFRVSESNEDVDYRGIRIKKVRMGNTKDGLVRVRIDPQLTGTPRPLGRLQDPDVAWTDMVNPFTATVSATDATGTGYTDGDSVSYRLTAISSKGETLASTAINVADVGTPAKQIELEWEHIGLAAGYRIYRQVNGVGTYDLLFTVHDGHQVDDADASRNIQPPLTNDTESASIDIYDPPTNAYGGRPLGPVRLTAYSNNTLEFGTRELILFPGDSLAVEMDPDSNSSVTLEVIWEEVLF